MKKAFPAAFLHIFALFVFLTLINGRIYAQTEFPAGDFWSLDAGLGMSNILVKGTSYQFIIDPKLWLSPPLMVGSKVGINYSAEHDSSEKDLGNILTFEGQVYLRWNFLRLGKNHNKKTNIFVQGGLGLISAYRGTDNPFNDVTETRGSLLADAGLGITIPFTERWHIEPSIRAGYPHIFGAAVTVGYKFPLPQKTKYQVHELPGRTEYITEHQTEYVTEYKTEYVEIVKTLPPEEIVKMVKISAIEFILFGPDISMYNIGIDRDAQQLNELVLNSTSKMLIENPNYRVRLEGHANPYTINHSEIEELMILSAMRTNIVAEQLRQRGVHDEQIVMIHFGGSRAATNEWDVRNRNRRVEMIIIEINDN